MHMLFPPVIKEIFVQHIKQLRSSRLVSLVAFPVALFVMLVGGGLNVASAHQANYLSTSPHHSILITSQNFQHYVHHQANTSVAGHAAVPNAVNCPTFGIQSVVNGLYVTAELGGTGNNYAMLRARSATVGPWERFCLQNNNDNTWSIQSAENGLYVTAELGGTGNDYARLRARSATVGSWERFFLYSNGSAFTFQYASNNLYATAELGGTGNDYARLRARSATVGPWEQFNLV